MQRIVTNTKSLWGPQGREPQHYCPCCGRDVDIGAGLKWHREQRVLTGRGMAVAMTPNEARIFNVLWSARIDKAMLSCEAVFERAWSNDPDNSPANSKIVSIYIIPLRRKLQKFKLEIHSRVAKGEAGGYRLVDRRQAPEENEKALFA